MDKEFVIVTRHSGVVEWLKRKGIEGVVVPHATIEDVKDKVVIGNIPLHLAAEASRVVSIDIPALPAEKRGQELTPEEMDEYGATLTGYIVIKDLPMW